MQVKLKEVTSGEEAMEAAIGVGPVDATFKVMLLAYYCSITHVLTHFLTALLLTYLLLYYLPRITTLSLLYYLPRITKTHSTTIISKAISRMVKRPASLTHYNITKVREP